MAKSHHERIPAPITLTLIYIEDNYTSIITNVYEWLNEDSWLYVRTSSGPNFDFAVNMALLKEINFSD